MLATVMKPLFYRSPWQDRSRLAHAVPPGKLREWLFDAGSLTRALVQLSNGQFQVQVLRQDWLRPSTDERRLLGIPAGRVAVVREVCLRGQDEPWVYARSILPETSLRGQLRFLRHFDDRPLGALLFSCPSMRRRRQQLARLPASALPAHLADAPYPAWGRRSVFLLYDQPLLVSEVFLPALVRRIG